jgi:hypothetical protein
MRYLSILLSFVLTSSAIAQCEPDFDFGTAEWGASPDPSAGQQFDTAYVDVPYFDVFHVLVPTDASAIDPMFTLPLDSVILVNVTLVDTMTLETLGLPDVGLDIVCNNQGSSPNPCTLISGDQYCASLEGTPTTGGVYQMTLEVEAWVTVFGVGVAQPYVFSGYVLDIVGESSSNGIAEDNAENWTLFPNPADDQLTLQGLPANAFIRVFNIAGQEVQVQADLKSGTQRTISTSNWAEGIYFVVAESAHEVVTQRLVVQH